MCPQAQVAGRDNNNQEMRIKRNKTMAIMIGVVAGAVVGYLYYRFIGCRTGACVITRNPITSMLYGALLGGLAANVLK